jgi:hypothetical protein
MKMIQSRWLISGALAAGLAFTGCGDDDEGGGETTVDNPQTTMASQTTAQKSAALLQIDDTVDANAQQQQIHEVGTSMNGLVGAFQAAKAQDDAGSAAGSLPDGVPGSIPGALTSATFNQMQGLTYTDGNISGGFSFDQAGTSYAYVIDLTFGGEEGAQTIDGTFNVDFSTTQGVSLDYDLDASYSAFTVDGAGCAVGGSITVNYSIDVASDGGTVPGGGENPLGDVEIPGGAVSQSGSVTAAYGPDCGTVTVSGN